MSSSQFRRSKRRFDDDESTFLKRDRHRRRLPPPTGWRSSPGPPRTAPRSPGSPSTPGRAGLRDTRGLACHRPRGRRHRTRHPEDRQGGRRLPAAPRRARHRPVLPARGQAVPGRGAPDVPARQRVSRRPARPGVEGEPGDRGAVRGGPGDDLHPVGARRVRRPESALRGRPASAVSGADTPDRAAAGVHRRAGRHGRAAAGRDQAGWG